MTKPGVANWNCKLAVAPRNVAAPCHLGALPMCDNVQTSVVAFGRMLKRTSAFACGDRADQLLQLRRMSKGRRRIGICIAIAMAIGDRRSPCSRRFVTIELRPAGASAEQARCNDGTWLGRNLDGMRHRPLEDDSNTRHLFSSENQVQLRFEEKSSLGRGSFIAVTRQNIPLGYIRQRPDTGAYCYFRGTSNVAKAIFERDNLEALKMAIEKNP